MNGSKGLNKTTLSPTEPAYAGLLIPKDVFSLVDSLHRKNISILKAKSKHFLHFIFTRSLEVWGGATAQVVRLTEW
jgi:hypothetical protein